MQKKVVLVGAGINGLIFANLLVKKGYMVKLIESGPSIGVNFKAVTVGAMNMIVAMFTSINWL